MVRVRSPVWAAVRIVSVLTALSCVGFTATAFAAPTQEGCAALATLVIPADRLDLPTGGVSLASTELSTSERGALICHVDGAIHPISAAAPDINFQVNLPLAWNGRTVHFGGGGYNGSLVDATRHLGNTDPRLPTPLAQGYVTYGSDSGHQGASPLDGSFLMDDEALANFGGLQLKKTHDVAMALVDTFYGRMPEYRYFAGASQGGHEALTVAQRWPLDYDGVSVTYPAYNFTALQLSGNNAGRALYAPGAKLSPADVGTLNRAVYQACDGLDGVEDGIVSHTTACEAAFDVGTLRCGGEAAPGCLTGAQIAVLEEWNRAYEAPITLQGGAEGFGRWPIYLGGDLYGLWGMGERAEPAQPPEPVADAGLHVLADPLIRFAIMRDPGFDSLDFDPATAVKRISEVSYLLDASDPNLSAFRDHGGKMLLMHGTIDFAISPFNTIAYYDRVVETFGRRATDDFVRFYMVPGFGHGSGVFKLGWDPLAPLVAWVEDGAAPRELVGIDLNEETAGRTRPMCLYPAYPMYKEGATDPNTAESFACVRPERDP